MRPFLVCLIVLLTGSALAADQPISFGNFYALVIGNNEYEKLPRLQTAVSDAGAVAELLRARYTFKEVKLVINASHDRTLDELNRLRATLTEKDHLLIYYAGHGVHHQAADEGYWLPVDADPAVDTRWIPNGRISGYLRSMSARHVLIIADSCYAGALVRSAGATPAVGGERIAWLTRMAAKRARTALTSGGLEPVVDGGRDGHSVFATALLQALRENTDLLDGQSLYQLVRAQVVLNADQTPAYSDVRNSFHEGGDFVFVPLRATPVAAAPVAPPAAAASTGDRTALELAFWNSVRDSTNPAALEAYLAQYPDGTFAALAKLRLAELERPAPPPRTAMVQPSAPVAPPTAAPPLAGFADGRYRLRVQTEPEGSLSKCRGQMTFRFDGTVAVAGRRFSFVGYDGGARLDLKGEADQAGVLQLTGSVSLSNTFGPFLQMQRFAGRAEETAGRYVSAHRSDGGCGELKVAVELVPAGN